MWEQESNKYWKEKRSQSFQKKVSDNKTTIIAGVAVLLLLVVGGVGYFMTASRGKPVVLSDEPIRLFTVTPKQKAKCLETAGDNDNYAPHKCQKLCHKVKNSLPRPTSHRSCTDGCKAGATQALQLGCSSVTTAKACREEASAHCNEQCADYLNQFPRPALYDLCRNNCNDILAETCDHAIKELAVARKLPDIKMPVPSL